MARFAEQRAQKGDAGQDDGDGGFEAGEYGGEDAAVGHVCEVEGREDGLAVDGYGPGAIYCDVSGGVEGG